MNPDINIQIHPSIPINVTLEMNLRKNNIVIPKELTPPLAYFVGLLRDGNLSRAKRSYKIRIYQKDKAFLENVVNRISQHLFNKKVKIMKSGEDFVWQVDSKPLFLFLTKVFEYPPNKTQKWWKTPRLILEAPPEIQKWYIAGFVDAEGSICLEDDKPVIYVYHSWNNQTECPPLSDLKLMLNKWGINSNGPYLYKHSNNAFRLRIRNKNALTFLQTIPLVRKTYLSPIKRA